MRVTSWPMSKRLQLPDECFGRRFLISCCVEGGDAAAAWDISELAFPELAVIWEVRVVSEARGVDVASVRLALGDQLPTSTAMVDGLEPLIPGLGLQGGDPRVISLSLDGRMEWDRLRAPVASGGRRLVLEVTGAQGKTPIVTVGVVVSGFPNEVPEWLVSDRDKKP